MRRILYLVVPLLLLSAAGCINDKEADCDRTDIHFKYLANRGEDCFPDKIGKVSLYVYGKQGKLERCVSRSQAQLRLRQGVSLNLPTGEYRVVCWGNAFGYTRINNETDLNSAILAPPEYFTGETAVSNDSLYFGSLDIQVQREKHSDHTVYFNSSHIKMKILLAGLDELPPSRTGEVPVSIVVDNINPALDFSEQCCRETLPYSPLLVYDRKKKEYIGRFNVTRFGNDNAVKVKLVGQGNVLYELELEQYMKQHGICVESVEEVTIGIRFRFNKSTVTIEPWDEQEIKPGEQ